MHNKFIDVKEIIRESMLSVDDEKAKACARKR